MPINFDQLWQVVLAQYRGRDHAAHGPDHWRRVERNGLLLATRTGADVEVVRLFALFHDSRRLHDGADSGHGGRGAAYAATLRGQAFELDDARFALFHHACTWHTDGDHHDDPTIGTCWDADRLDLRRLAIIPDPKYLSTAFARAIATQGSVQHFLHTPAGRQADAAIHALAPSDRDPL